MSDKGKSTNEHLGDYVELYYPEIKKTSGFCNYLLSQRMKELANAINNNMAAVAERINKMRGGKMKIKENSIVTLNDGRKGKVIGQLENGEYILASGQGGQVTYFKAEDIIS